MQQNHIYVHFAVKLKWYIEYCCHLVRDFRSYISWNSEEMYN